MRPNRYRQSLTRAQVAAAKREAVAKCLLELERLWRRPENEIAAGESGEVELENKLQDEIITQPETAQAVDADGFKSREVC